MFGSRSVKIMRAGGGVASGSSGSSFPGYPDNIRQTYVNVAFDFEYISEEGKKIYMKENEILLLINKTNQDWWQVIRRGDRRPFYAPAKYVVEIRPEDVFRFSVAEPSSLTDQRFYNHKAFSTFGNNDSHPPSSDHLQQQQKYNCNNSKRSSYSPAGSVTVPPAAAVEPHLFNGSSSRFHERYRSNSLDSILVSDRTKKMYSVRDINTDPPRASIPLTSGGGGTAAAAAATVTQSVTDTKRKGYLEKRPTFDGLDKRKSWSVIDNSSYSSSMPKSVSSRPAPPVNNRLVASANSRLSAYQNTQGLHISLLSQQQQNSNIAKKPVPLPRSKIPVATSTANYQYQHEHRQQQQQTHTANRLFRRSKTDLCTNGLHAYKANRQQRLQQHQTKYPAPKIPMASSSRPIPQKRPLPSPTAQVIQFRMSMSSSQPSSSSKPEIKEKPVLSTFKSNNEKAKKEENSNSNNLKKISSPTKNFASISRVLSESDLTQVLRLKEENEEEPVEIEEEKFIPPPPLLLLDTVEESSANTADSAKENSNSNSIVIIETGSDNIVIRNGTDEIKLPVSKKEENKKRTEEVVSVVRNGTDEIKLPVSKKKENKKRTEEVVNVVRNGTDEIKLPVSKEEENKKRMEEVVSVVRTIVSVVKSEPLQITTEPLNHKGNENENNDEFVKNNFNNGSNNDETELLNNNHQSSSTSCDSFDDTSIAADPETDKKEEFLSSFSSPKHCYGNSPPSHSSSSFKSPLSTTSRSPPSPQPGMTPTRQVMLEWDEYNDGVSGRKFYYNTLTKEKSWKPPRKSKGSSEGYSAPTSPDPESDTAKRKLDMEDEALTSEKEDEQQQRRHQQEDILKEERDDTDSSPKKTEERIIEDIPSGYEKRTNTDTGTTYYINMFTGVRWFSAKDADGKIYFYEENGNESCWALPNVSQSIQDHNSSSNPSPEPPTPSTSEKMSTTTTTTTATVTATTSSSSSSSSSTTNTTNSTSTSAKQSMTTEVLKKGSSFSSSSPPSKKENEKLTRFISSPNIQIGSVNIVVLKQGPLNKTKLVENGKKQRKNWSLSHVVLTDTFILFFKDAKAFAASMSSGSQIKPDKPDHCVDLKGATIQWCKGEKSKRSNVFEISSSLLGLTILLQEDNLSIAGEWFKEIIEVLNKFNGIDSNPDTAHATGGTSTSLSTIPSLKSDNSLKGKKNIKVSRTKSLKMKILGSNEELEISPNASSSSESIPTNNTKTNIREKLRKFFQRRPAMEDLFRKGIIKNEPVFGSTLKELQATELNDVPQFVRKCIAEIEKGDLLKTDGVYRQSGNLSTIQKIRFQVDQGNLGILETVDDVHVLTGSLKLFFRELKEPLIPWECVDSLLQATTHHSRKIRARLIREALSKMPSAHRTTLQFLLRHLIKVTEYKDTNRMQIPNLAIVFGPTLMWPPPSMGVSNNLALDMMQQNIIVETLLSHLQLIF